jgi:hypothetical protein
MRSALVSAISGDSVETSMDVDCFFSLDLSSMTHAPDPIVWSSLDGTHSVGESIPLLTPPAPVSGALILGNVNAELRACVHLTANQNFDTGEHVGDEAFENNLKLVNTYRLFGHDVVLKDVYGNITTPWAPVRELLIEPSSLKYTQDFVYSGLVQYSKPRSGRNVHLPMLSPHMPTRKMSLHVMKPNVFLQVYRRRAISAPAVIRPVRRVKPIIFTIKNTRTAIFTKTLVPGYDKVVSGFQGPGTGIAPRNPPMRKENTETASMASLAADASTADTSHPVEPGSQDLGTLS